MELLDNFLSYDAFTDCMSLKEGLTDGMQNACNRAFANGDVIKFTDGSSVHPKEIIKVVSDALVSLSFDYYNTFKFGQRMNIIYLRSSKKIETMAVDENMNLYMNAGFIYHTLKMDPYLIRAVIFHEILHVLFNHIEREKNYYSSKGMSHTGKNHHDSNLAADVEVNQTIIRLEVLKEEELVNVIHGIYLKNRNNGSGVTVNPMESILSNEEQMEILRSMSPYEDTPEGEKDDDKEKANKTTEDWDQGYKDAWNHIAKLQKKYGTKGLIEKLQEEGILLGDGAINMDIEKIKLLEGFRVSGFSSFCANVIEESISGNGYSTYEDGYKYAVEKIIGALTPSGKGGGGGGGQKQPKIDSSITQDDLDPIELPPNDGDDSEGDGGDGMKDNMKSPGGGSGESKSDEDLTDDDYNKLADDLKKKSSDGGEGEGEGQDGSKKNKGSKGSKGTSGDRIEGIGSTGSYVDSSEIGDDVLKESGYSDDEIELIKKVLDNNRERNSKEGIEKAREEMKSRETVGILRKFLDAIAISEEKYKNVWEKILEKFMAKKSRKAGLKKQGKDINWFRRSRVAMGQLGPQYNKVDQEPQDINIHVDVSGSMDIELLEIIAKSIVVLCEKYKYSGLNICPWASTANGIHKVESVMKSSPDQVTKDILSIISKGSSQCGEGTSATAAMSAILSTMSDIIENSPGPKKDHVHIVITDGEFDYENIEERLKNTVLRVTNNNNRVAQTVVENTVWMLYDADRIRESWEKEIKTGKIIFLNSEAVKSNA